MKHRGNHYSLRTSIASPFTSIGRNDDPFHSKKHTQNSFTKFIDTARTNKALQYIAYSKRPVINLQPCRINIAKFKHIIRGKKPMGLLELIIKNRWKGNSYNNESADYAAQALNNMNSKSISEMYTKIELPSIPVKQHKISLQKHIIIKCPSPPEEWK